MAESIGADIGTRILQAVEGLGLRMDRLEARMDGLEARMDRLEARMDKLEVQVTDLDSRMAKQERLMEMLGAEFIKSRDALRGDIQQVRTDMNEGFRRLNARIDLTDSVVVLMAAELRRPRELSEQLETHLRHIEAR
jgi:chromosome segregation ATPase